MGNARRTTRSVGTKPKPPLVTSPPETDETDEDQDDSGDEDSEVEEDGDSVRIAVEHDVLSIGTLSWDGDENAKLRLSGRDFHSALRIARRQAQSTPDLILCAGRTMVDTWEPSELLDASGGVPVLYETEQDDGTEGWWCDIDMGDGPQSVCLREEQIFAGSQEAPEKYTQLARTIAEQQGVVWVDRKGRSPMPLVLLICGENNTLTAGRKLGLLSDLPRQMVKRSDLNAVLGGQWIALNPAHRPYWPQFGRKGFTKVGTNAGRGPTLGNVVWSEDAGSFGVAAPRAVVHCNNFLRDEAKTHDYASLAFVRRSVSKSGVLKPTIRVAPSETQDSIISWSYSEYELPLN